MLNMKMYFGAAALVASSTILIGCGTEFSTCENSDLVCGSGYVCAEAIEGFVSTEFCIREDYYAPCFDECGDDESCYHMAGNCITTPTACETDDDCLRNEIGEQRYFRHNNQCTDTCNTDWEICAEDVDALEPVSSQKMGPPGMEGTRPAPPEAEGPPAF